MKYLVISTSISVFVTRQQSWLATEEQQDTRVPAGCIATQKIWRMFWNLTPNSTGSNKECRSKQKPQYAEVAVFGSNPARVTGLVSCKISPFESVFHSR